MIPDSCLPRPLSLYFRFLPTNHHQDTYTHTHSRRYEKEANAHKDPTHPPTPPTLHTNTHTSNRPGGVDWRRQQARPEAVAAHSTQLEPKERGRGERRHLREGEREREREERGRDGEREIEERERGEGERMTRWRRTSPHHLRSSPHRYKVLLLRLHYYYYTTTTTTTHLHA